MRSTASLSRSCDCSRLSQPTPPVFCSVGLASVDPAESRRGYACLVYWILSRYDAIRLAPGVVRIALIMLDLVWHTAGALWTLSFCGWRQSRCGVSDRCAGHAHPVQYLCALRTVVRLWRHRNDAADWLGNAQIGDALTLSAITAVVIGGTLPSAAAQAASVVPSSARSYWDCSEISFRSPISRPGGRPLLMPRLLCWRWQCPA